MKSTRIIAIGLCAVVIGGLLTLLTPAGRPNSKIESDRVSGRLTEEGLRFDLSVLIQHVAYDAVAVFGVGMLIVGVRRFFDERKGTPRLRDQKTLRSVAAPVALAALFAIYRLTGATSTIPSRSIQYVTVERDVKLEVVDWGGAGRALVFVPGLGFTASEFDDFASKFTSNYHVYGITRRGFGNSSRPASGYSADRLGDDVLAVINALKLDRPVLVGHSMGGAELSSVASRFPHRVAGLVYLDAAYAYAYFSPESPPPFPIDPKWPAPVRAILAGQQQYTDIRVPALAIYAIPTDQSWRGKKDAAFLAKMEAEEVARNLPQMKAFERGVPSAKVINIPHANHWVFWSNEAEVLLEMKAFLGTLK